MSASTRLPRSTPTVVPLLRLIFEAEYPPPSRRVRAPAGASDRAAAERGARDQERDHRPGGYRRAEKHGRARHVEPCEQVGPERAERGPPPGGGARRRAPPRPPPAG